MATTDGPVPVGEDGAPPSSDGLPDVPGDGPALAPDHGAGVDLGSIGGGPLTQAQRQTIVDSVVLSTPVDLSKSPCLGKSNTKDARGKLVTTNFSGVSVPAPGCIVGAAVRGTFSRSLGWADVKKSHDGDGIKWGNPKPGLVTIHGAYIDNIEDPIGPPKSPATNRSSTWLIKNVYGRYSRDDFVENDACLDGKIEDTLVDGTHVFISARPGKSNQAKMAKYSATHEVANTLVHMSCKPDPRDEGGGDKCPKHTSVQGIFKWSACGGKVNMRDTIIRVDAQARKNNMDWPPGTYKNVWLIYLKGKYPGKLPASGVTEVLDLKLWEMARDKWMKRHGCDPKGDHCTAFDN